MGISHWFVINKLILIAVKIKGITDTVQEMSDGVSEGGKLIM